GLFMKSALACLLCVTTGCGAILASKTKTVIVNSNPPGAQVMLDGMPAGQTPGTIVVDNKKSHVVTFKAQGYADGQCNLTTHVGVVWLILDIFLTGLIGV